MLLLSVFMVTRSLSVQAYTTLLLMVTVGENCTLAVGICGVEVEGELVVGSL